MGGWVAKGLPLVLLLALLPPRVVAQTNPAASLPALPSVVLETFPESARVAIQRAIDLAKAHADDAETCGALGMTLQAWEQWETAHTAYERATRLSAHNADWLYLDGVVLQRMGRPADASERFQRALTLAPESVPARARLAEALFDAGDLEASRAPIRGSRPQPAAAPVSALGLGRVAARDGRHDDAIAHFDRPSRCSRSSARRYYGLAQSLRALRRSEEARDALEQHATFTVRAGRPSTIRWPRGGARCATTRWRSWLADLRRHRWAMSPAPSRRTKRRSPRNPSLAQARANLISLYGRTRPVGEGGSTLQGAAGDRLQ